MLQFFERLLRPRPFSAYTPFDLLPRKVTHRFWRSRKNGTTVSVYVPDCDETKTLSLVFQHAITPLDVQNGKLTPIAWERIKRRGGKRQTGLALSLETAEALHSTLGKALKCAKAKERQAQTRDLIVSTLWASMEMAHKMAPK